MQRSDCGLPDHIIKIGHDGRSRFAILLGKPIEKDLKPDGQGGRFGTQHHAKPFANLVADRATMHAVDLPFV